MKICVYVNKEKDSNKAWLNGLRKISENKVELQVLSDDDLTKKIKADALIVYGGDGTILALTEFAYKNNLPIVGINAGKIGFLTEYENYETEKALNDILANDLITEKRLLLEMECGNKKILRA